MPITIFRHTGDFDDHTRENRALRFIEGYVRNISSDITLSYPDTKWYSPNCIFFDTTNVTYTGAKAIKTWMLKLFSPYDRLGAEGMRFQVVHESDEISGAKYTVNAELMTAFYLKGDPEPVLIPRIFVFVIEDSETKEGFDGLQYTDVRLYWDTDLVKSEARRRAAKV
jgi:hypothetical protein